LGAGMERVGGTFDHLQMSSALILLVIIKKPGVDLLLIRRLYNLILQ